MSTTKHTPGPWYVNDSGFGVYYVNPLIEAGDDTIDDPSHDSVIADTINMGAFSGIPDDDRLANAKLIAAAPGLLAACRTAAGWCNTIVNDEADSMLPQLREQVFGLQKIVCDAIAKAEGSAAR